MQKLILSLDKKIFIPTSRVALRMIQYGQKDEIFIVVPTEETKRFDLSATVHVIGTGGNKIVQYQRLKKLGLDLIKKHHISVVTVQDPSFLGNIGCWLKKKTGASLEIQIHGDFFGSDFYKRTLKDRIGYQFFGKRNVRRADSVRAVGERVKRTVLDMGVDDEKILIQPVENLKSFLSDKQVNVRQEYPGHEKYFLFVGRLESVKGVDMLIDIFDDLVHGRDKNYFLLILGDGSKRETSENKVRRRKLQNNISFGGYAQMPESYYKNVDCVVFPSHSEGYGLVSMEAVEAGAKVIMTNVGVANFELKPSATTRIVPVGDTDAFIKEMLSI